MTKKTTMIRAGALALGFASAGITISVFEASLYRHGLRTVLLVFVVLLSAYYNAWMWAMVDRSAELAARLPITSRELRARKKAFYDWLASQRPFRRRSSRDARDV